MKTFRKFVMLGILLAVCLTGHAIDANLVYYFTHIDNRNGLSENCVKAITQDRLGFIWLGTKNGLDRYDGCSLKHYDVDDLQTARGNHNVSALCEDADGQLWVGTDKGVFVLNLEDETFRSLDTKTDDDRQIRNWIAQVLADEEGCIWVVSPEEGVFCYDTKKRTMKCYNPRDHHNDPSYNPQYVSVRSDGTVWIGTGGQGLFLLNRKSGVMTQEMGLLAGQSVYTMADYGEYILIGEHMGRLLKFHPKTQEMTVVDAPNVHYKVIRDIDVDGDNIFVATQDGLYIVNEAAHTEQRLHENGLMPNTLSDNMIYTLYRDRQDGLWIGTMQSGVNYMPRRGLHFYCYKPTGMPGSLSRKHIREMQTDTSGRIWISTEEGQINIFDPKTQQFQTLNTPQYKGGPNRLALMADGDRMWSGLFKNGLDIISVSSHQLTHYSPDDLGLQGEGSVYALFRDSKGNVWLGSGRGAYIQSGNIHFNKVTAIPDVFVQDIAEDKQGYIWLTTIGSGVYRHHPQSARTDHFSMQDGQLLSNDVSSISIDHKGQLWFATDRGGITSYDPDTKEWHTYGRKDGLPDDVTYKVLEDSLHRLWFGTNHGLACGAVEIKHLMVYQNQSGLPGNQYNYKSAVAGADGTFYFGGTQGLVAFNPMLAGKTRQGRVLITNLRVDHEDVHPSKGGILSTNIIEAREIRLPYNFSNLSLYVSSLDYTGEEGDSYEYQIKGMDKNWTLVRNNNISFSRLQPGTYTLCVRPGGGGEVAELKIIVRHPWWSTWWAQLCYTLLILGLAYFVWQRLKRRQQEEMEQRERAFREEQEKELLQAKIGFFTDITHEIRTPLTLISGSVENIEGTQIEDSYVKKNLTAIAKNSKRLLNLINQLLDFRKMDTKSMKLSYVNTDVCQLVGDILEHFEPAAGNQNKTLSLDSEEEKIVIPVDQEAVTKIMSNLLNNALKYSETFIQVSVARRGEELVDISVINDGERIPREKRDEIFLPFTRLEAAQNTTGTGIGLPLARSLAELHGGRLSLDTTSEYNTFVLTLPTHQEHVIEVEAADSMAAAVALQDTAVDDYDNRAAKKEYTVLIVEDNEEVRQMVVDQMRDRYHVLTAENGQKGLETLKAEHVDLVVSDVMMPVMDGFEMCRRLKEDIEVNHIPIIMLTAKQTLDNRLEGLRAGADAYIEKPFSFAHLMTQVETLLANRKRERESFLHKPYLPVQQANIDKAKEDFLNKISMLITKNIKDPEFNVEQLASDMCMSRSSLHRKIKEVSSLTPIDFIRLIRLKKAAELIREYGYRSSEVCEMVGINSPSYFIKLFQKQFGMTPKEFAQKGE